MQARRGRCKAAGRCGAGWLGRVQGGLGRALGAPRVDLVRLAFTSRTERMKVTSTPEVPGPSRSWSPAPAVPSSPLDLRICAFTIEGICVVGFKRNCSGPRPQSICWRPWRASDCRVPVERYNSTILCDSADRQTDRQTGRLSSRGSPHQGAGVGASFRMRRLIKKPLRPARDAELMTDSAFLPRKLRYFSPSFLSQRTLP